jgi:crotonobetaine/carnitine-CoA ligase
VFIEEVGGATFTTADFLADTLRFADALERLGVQEGHCVAAMLEPCAQSHMFWLGTSWLRAIEVPINTEYRGAFLVHALNDSKAKIFVTTSPVLARLEEITPQLSSLETVVLADTDHGEWSGGRVVGIDEFLDRAQPTERAAPQEYHSYAVIYTSGTTGPSKGVVSPWRLQHETVWSMFPGDRRGDYPGGAVYSPWPVFHGTGKNALVIAAELDLRVVIRDRFSVSAFWDDVTKYGCTHVNLMGFGSLLLNQPPRDTDATNPLRRALMLPLPTRYREFEERFGVKLSTIWGMTEIGLPLSAGDPPNSSACGKLRSLYEARLVDEHDYDVAHGEPGEFIIRSQEPWLLMTEYLGRPDATAKSWRNGWFHTGDILRQDDDGYYYFVDRAADYVRRRGHNISSLEVEAAVTAHPQVDSCACIGVPSTIAEMDDTDADAPERAEVAKDLDVKIVVSLVDGATVTEAELLAYLIDNMPRFMVPRFIEFVDEMPRTPTMKIRKAELRKAPIGPNTWDREAHGIEIPR